MCSDFSYQRLQSECTAQAKLWATWAATVLRISLDDLNDTGIRGDRIARRATILVVVVISQLVYACLGIFGAARYGLATNGNILGNSWLPLRAQVLCR